MRCCRAPSKLPPRQNSRVFAPSARTLPPGRLAPLAQAADALLAACCSNRLGDGPLAHVLRQHFGADPLAHVDLRLAVVEDVLLVLDDVEAQVSEGRAHP